MPTNAVASTLRVDGARLWRSLMDLAQIGATARGGVCRLALTDLDRQGRDLVAGWLRDAGCTIEIDGVGNVFAIRRGRPAAPPRGVGGRHNDTPPTGGQLDGH
jgi:N-carbamoyl-L-amino-acid hydrolase